MSFEEEVVKELEGIFGDAGYEADEQALEDSNSIFPEDSTAGISGSAKKTHSAAILSIFLSFVFPTQVLKLTYNIFDTHAG